MKDIVTVTILLMINLMLTINSTIEIMCILFLKKGVCIVSKLLASLTSMMFEQNVPQGS